MKLHTLFFYLFLLVLCITIPVSVYAEGVAVDTLHTDSAKVKQLDEVSITAKNALKVSSTPLQELSQYRLKELNSLQVSDAVKHFSGVVVKDYGGIGGLKTVSVRSLGAAHTAVAIDGIAMGNAQNGQIDIGKFSLDNVGVISLANGQNDDIFQPARQVSAASVLKKQFRRMQIL